MNPSLLLVSNEPSTRDAVVDAVSGLGRALLVCHSPADRTVGIDNANELFLAARHPKCFLSLDSADHLCSNADDARYAGAMIATWSRRYLND